jgi:[acyl-carrier-protein] S-malonyltransferase
MIALLFPGQGSQEVGMGADLFREDSEFRELVRHASDCAGTDLERLCLRGPERELCRPEWLQPLLVTVSLGYLRRLTRCGIQADFVLGHSLGEISALAAAGVLDFEQAVEVAAHRGRCMAAAARRVEGGMIAVTGKATGEILRVVAPLIEAGRVFLANDNAPTQLVLSGTNRDLEEAIYLLAQAKAGAARKLAVAGPWHCPLMAEAEQEFAKWFARVPLSQPRIPILMNHSAVPEMDPDRLRECVVRNLTGTARWRSSMDRLREVRPRLLLEVGPGRVLSGLARANGFGDEVHVINVNNLRGVDRAAALLAENSDPPSPCEGRPG